MRSYDGAMRPWALTVVAGIVLAALATGCNRQPAVPDPTAARSPSPRAGETSTPARATAPARTARPATGTPTAFSDSFAVNCAGRPTPEQVIAVVRRQPSLLPSSAGITVKTGPLCAGTWQYTVLEVTGSEPLQVVTRGAPAALAFVTAGTNVCTVDVRAYAPIGIRDTARC